MIAFGSNNILETKRRFQQGFSLLEVILVVFLFALTMVAVTSYFVKMAYVNQNLKRLQANLQDAQLVFNVIGKTLRTSVVLSPESKKNYVLAYDYSQHLCVLYQFQNNTITSQLIAGPPNPNDDEKTWCQTQYNNNNLGSPATLVSVQDGATVAGRFKTTPSTDTVAGRVTMVGTVSRGTNSSTIETTVSLRNFREIAP